MVFEAPSKSFFDSLIAWDELDRLLELVPESEQDEASKLVLSLLDYAVMQTVLKLLHEDHHHEFLQLCHQRYHEPHLLFWLEEKAQGMTEEVRHALGGTYQHLHTLLQSIHESDRIRE